MSRAVQQSCLAALASIELRDPSQHCYLALLRAGLWRLLRICFLKNFMLGTAFVGSYTSAGWVVHLSWREMRCYEVLKS